VASGLTLDTDVQFVKGVGPIRAKHFSKLGVRNVGDLVHLFPFRHECKPQSQPIGTVEPGGVSTVIGELKNVRTGGRFSGGTISAQVIDGTGRCKVRWFNSGYLADRLHPGIVVRLTGKVDLYNERPQIINPEISIIEEGEDPFAEDHERREPVYPSIAELSSRQIKRLVESVLDIAAPQIEEILPAALRKKRNLPPRRTAIIRYHRPTGPMDVEVARRRIAYDEFFLFQLAIQTSRRKLKAGPRATRIEVTTTIDERIRKRFPFSLTKWQDRSVAEICADLCRDVPMNRLLQADVGAGKTAVAVYASLAAIARKRQVAMLAPTEVLASQLFTKVQRYMAGSRVRVGYLAGSVKASERTTLLCELANGKLDWIIGTHALVEKKVRFAKLGLVIIDEQHKFGVAQRAALRQKGPSPHVLVLTATPIPRTLAMTVFGDLDVSTIDGSPPGRKPVVTRLATEEKRREAWRFVRSRVDKGEQAYVVYPLVEESDALPLKAATVEVERLRETFLEGCSVELLHGRMKAADKKAVMERFRSGKTKVLVATTVIEVGVDVASATLMVIEHAERFGLSQLHQLRGRVGRGSKKSYCLLMSDARGATARERLGVLCKSNDGFRIAEEDLRLRGPGELIGKRQHGIPAFRVADLVTDFEILEQARDDAAAILRADPLLEEPGHTALKKALLSKHRGVLNLADVA
jgi:ATP-dependent DNA helicase RecG